MSSLEIAPPMTFVHSSRSDSRTQIWEMRGLMRLLVISFLTLLVCLSGQKRLPTSFKKIPHHASIYLKQGSKRIAQRGSRTCIPCTQPLSKHHSKIEAIVSVMGAMILTAKNAQVRPRVLKKGWTKSQQNDLTWLLFRFTGRYFIYENHVSVSTRQRSNSGAYASLKE